MAVIISFNSQNSTMLFVAKIMLASCALTTIVFMSIKFTCSLQLEAEWCLGRINITGTPWKWRILISVSTSPHYIVEWTNNSCLLSIAICDFADKRQKLRFKLTRGTRARSRHSNCEPKTFMITSWGLCHWMDTSLARSIVKASSLRQASYQACLMSTNYQVIIWPCCQDLVHQMVY